MKGATCLEEKVEFLATKTNNLKAKMDENGRLVQALDDLLAGRASSSQAKSRKFVRLSEMAVPPSRGHDGYYLYSACELVVPPKGSMAVETDIRIRVPDGCFGRLAGLAALKAFKINVSPGRLDLNSAVTVLMYNFGDIDFYVKPGDRIAELLICECNSADFQECETLDEPQSDAVSTGSSAKKAKIDA